jgi:nucleoside-diphosphate-sugar epimerase
MRVLVTGLDGFTGRYVQAELESAGHEVIEFTGDLRVPAEVDARVAAAAPEAVVHLAAIAFVAHDDVKDIYDVNLLGTRNLLQSLARHAPNLSAVLLTSSANVYGNQHSGLIDETCLPAPANDYAVSKLAMEHMARLWQDRLPLFVARPFNYTGVGQEERFVIPKIVAHFRARMPVIELGNLDVWREYGDVRVVASIYAQLLENRPVGATLNVCSGRAHSLREVLDMCREISGHDIEVRQNPAFMRDNEIRELKGDNARLRSIVGDLAYPPLEETLAWMLEA